MPIITIDVFSSSAPLPTNMYEVVLRMFELLLQNNLKADSKTARRYARFIKILRRVNEQLPADAPVRQDKDWEEVMNYALLREIRMIDIKKPADENLAAFSRETILQRIGAGYEATKRSLEETPLSVQLSDDAHASSNSLAHPEPRRAPSTIPKLGYGSLTRE